MRWKTYFTNSPGTKYLAAADEIVGVGTGDTVKFVVHSGAPLPPV